MHLSTAHKKRLLQAARLATAGAMVASSLGAAVTQSAFAAQLVSNKTLVSDSRPSQSNVTYTQTFFPSVTTTAIAYVAVEYCTTADTFTAACTAPTGMDNAITGASAAGFGGSAGASAGTFTRDSANQFHFVPTTPATETNISHSLVLTTVTNSSVAGTYYVRLRTYSDAGTTPLDDGTSAFAIVSAVQVSGRVLESMTFTVTLVNNATACAGAGGDTSTAASTATTVPFGNFASGTPRVVCQKVKTATNALSGYNTTIRETNGGASPIGGMCRQTATNCGADGGTSGVSATDVIVDATLNSTPASWTNGTTFGLGVNANGTEADSAYGGATNYRSLFGATPIAVANKTGPTTGTDTYVVFKADVNSAQTAGVYQTSVEYVSTPTF